MKTSLISFLLLSIYLISCNRQKQYDRNFTSEDDAYWFERTDAEDLSANNWQLWLDTTRSWRNDSLWLKPDVSKLPVNSPSCGWKELDNGIGRNIKLPATVEEHFWGQNGNTYGVTGDYTGISWFSTHFSVSDNIDKKRVILHFESARMRAEVYVNRKLAGYNLVDGTPFEVDATAFVKEGKNSLHIRITDPNGEFTWCDFPYLPWGKYLTVPSHGFGGITGRVRLYITDKSYIKDVFVKNKPTITDIEAEISLNREEQKAGTVYFTITPWGSRDIIAQDQITLSEDSARSVVRRNFSVPKAEQWSVNSPALYQLNVVWKGTDGSTDAFSRRFGFRWFEVRDVDGDKQFFLNNRRIVLRTAISWGFWPVNGIYPTREMAIKQINTAKKLGLNMLNFHRSIGQSMVLDLADELGLLYYEEPGGYRESDDEFAKAWSREKLMRMVKRDRSHPSLVIYNMVNESAHDPSSQAKIDIADAHRLDESRIITYTSTYFPDQLLPYKGKCPKTPAPIKLYMLPYNRELLYQGWWDEHHAPGPGSYYDEAYNGPDDYYLNSNNKSEIIFYGEEGAIGTPARFELIKNSLEQQDSKGWDGQDYQQLFETYDRFISEKGFRKAFPNVDNLTRGMGNVAYYYQGRAIENLRINNINDGYAINGWEENKLENHSGIVDSYRNPKGDVNLIANFNQPLFLAVKARNKVFETNTKTLVDIYIVNEIDINGDYELEVSASDSKEDFFKNTYPVKVKGGNTFGELLVQGIEVTPTKQGHCDIHARLIRDGELITEGSEQLYTVVPNKEDLNIPFSLMDTSGILGEYFKSLGFIPPLTYKDGRPGTNFVVVGASNPPENYPIRHDLFEWVAEGHTLVIAGNADKWAQSLGRREILDYRGSKPLGKYWYGGNYFVKENPLFIGLPVNCVFNWEYQCFVQYTRERLGLRLSGDDVVVGASSDHKQELFSAVSIIPLGKGKIILSSLDILGAIKEGRPSSVVAKKLLLNYMIYAEKNNR